MFVLMTLHLLSAVIWVGGMFFAYHCLRPVAGATLEPPVRLLLWQETFKRFFVWVWASVITLLITGHGMIGFYGGMGVIGLHVHLMMGVGYLMFLLFGHLYFAPFKRLKAEVAAKNWPEAAKNLNQIRLIVLINLSLGLAVVVVASAGPYVLG